MLLEYFVLAKNVRMTNVVDAKSNVLKALIVSHQAIRLVEHLSETL